MKDLDAKIIMRDFIIILGLTGVAGLYTSLAMPGTFGTIEHAGITRLLTLLLTTTGFTVIACLSPSVRWLQLVTVLILFWMFDGIYNLLLAGNPVKGWLINGFH